MAEIVVPIQLEPSERGERKLLLGVERAAKETLRREQKARDSSALAARAAAREMERERVREAEGLGAKLKAVAARTGGELARIKDAAARRYEEMRTRREAKASDEAMDRERRAVEETIRLRGSLTDAVTNNAELVASAVDGMHASMAEGAETQAVLARNTIEQLSRMRSEATEAAAAVREASETPSSREAAEALSGGVLKGAAAAAAKATERFEQLGGDLKEVAVNASEANAVSEGLGGTLKAAASGAAGLTAVFAKLAFLDPAGIVLILRKALGENFRLAISRAGAMAAAFAAGTASMLTNLAAIVVNAGVGIAGFGLRAAVGIKRVADVSQRFLAPVVATLRVTATAVAGVGSSLAALTARMPLVAAAARRLHVPFQVLSAVVAGIPNAILAVSTGVLRISSSTVAGMTAIHAAILGVVDRLDVFEVRATESAARLTTALGGAAKASRALIPALGTVARLMAGGLAFAAALPVIKGFLKLYRDIVSVGSQVRKEFEYLEVVASRVTGRADSLQAAFDTTGFTLTTTREMAQAVIQMERVGVTALSNTGALIAMADSAEVAGKSVGEVADASARLVSSLSLAAGTDATQRLLGDSVRPLQEMGIVSASAAAELLALNDSQNAVSDGLSILRREMTRNVGVGMELARTYDGLIKQNAAMREEIARRVTGSRVSLWFQKLLPRAENLFLRHVIKDFRTLNALLDVTGRAITSVMGGLVSQRYQLAEASREAAAAARDAYEAASAGLPGPSGPAIAPVGPVGAGDPSWRPDDEQRGVLDAAMSARELQRIYQRLDEDLQDVVASEREVADAAREVSDHMGSVFEAERVRRAREAIQASEDLAEETLRAAAAIDEHMQSVIADERAIRARTAAQTESRRLSIREDILGHDTLEEETRSLEDYRAVLRGIASDVDGTASAEVRTRAMEGYVEVLERANAAGADLTEGERSLLSSAQALDEVMTEAAASHKVWMASTGGRGPMDPQPMLDYLKNAGLLKVVVSDVNDEAEILHQTFELLEGTGSELVAAVFAAEKNMRALQAAAREAGREFSDMRVEIGTAGTALSKVAGMLGGISGGGLIGGSLGSLGSVMTGYASMGPLGAALGGATAAVEVLTGFVGENTRAQERANRVLDQVHSAFGLLNQQDARAFQNYGATYFGGHVVDEEGEMSYVDPMGPDQRKRSFMSYGKFLDDYEKRGGDMSGFPSAEKLLGAYRLTLELIEDIRKEEERRIDVIRKITAEALKEARAIRNDLKASYDGMTSALEGMASAVHGAFDLDPIERSIERMRELGLLTDVVANAYRALADAAHTPWREMQGLAEKFGIAQGGLGTGFAQSRVSGLGSELAEAFKTLMDAGGDPFQIAIGLMRTAQDEHGKPSEGGLEQVIRDALETGSLVPEELKPVLAALQNAGVLVDEISRLKFGDPGEDARNALHDLLSEINEQVHEAALENADLVIEGIQAASDAQIEKTQWLADTLVEAIERGHFDLDALTQWLGPDTRWTGPTKDGSPNDLFKILDGAQISLSGPILGADGQPIDFSFNMEGFKSELSGLLAALQPDPSKWQPIIDSIHAAFGLSPEWVGQLSDLFLNGIDMPPFPDFPEWPALPEDLTGWGWPTLPAGFTDWNWEEPPQSLLGWGWPDPPEGFSGWGWPDPPEDFSGWGWPSVPGALTAWGWPKPPEGFTGWGWPETPEDFTDWGWPTMPGDFTGWSWPGLPADFTDWVWPTVPSQSAQAIVAALTGGEHSVAGTASAIDASIHFTQGLLRLKLDDMWRGLAGDIGGIKLTCPAPVINVAPPVVNYSPPPASSAPKDQTVTFKVTDQGGHELSKMVMKNGPGGLSASGI